MSDILHNWEKKSAEHQKQYKQYLQKADKKKVLKQLPDLHDEAFSKIDCLTCAACCKNYSPRFKTPDIKRISKYLGMKEGAKYEFYIPSELGYGQNPPQGSKIAPGAVLIFYVELIFVFPFLLMIFFFMSL